MAAHTTTFALRVTPGGRAVTRLLTCCIGKGLDVVELSWCSEGAEARASLALRGDPALLARAELWLDRLVEVLEVKEEAAPLSRSRFQREE
jgi:hypothetical protein